LKKFPKLTKLWPILCFDRLFLYKNAYISGCGWNFLEIFKVLNTSWPTLNFRTVMKVQLQEKKLCHLGITGLVAQAIAQVRALFLADISFA